MHITQIASADFHCISKDCLRGQQEVLAKLHEAALAWSVVALDVHHSFASETSSLP